MATIEKFLANLKARQVDFAVEALSGSDHRDAFEFGRRSGIFQGLKMAEELLEEVLGATDEGSSKSAKP